MQRRVRILIAIVLAASMPAQARAQWATSVKLPATSSRATPSACAHFADPAVVNVADQQFGVKR
jgi:hypothetical protein